MPFHEHGVRTKLSSRAEVIKHEDENMRRGISFFEPLASLGFGKGEISFVIYLFQRLNPKGSEKEILRLGSAPSFSIPAAQNDTFVRFL